MKTQSKRFYQSLSIAIATTFSFTMCEISLGRPRGSGSFPRNSNVAPSINRGQTEAMQPPRVEQFQQRVQEVKSSPQFQQQVQEVKANSQFQQRVQEIKSSPQFQQQVQEIKTNIQTNPEAQQTLRDLQQSSQQFKVERREDWQNYLNETRDDRQDNHYYGYNYGNVGYGYDYFWSGYYPSYFVPFSTLSVSIFANDFDRYNYNSSRYYTSPSNENYLSSTPENTRVSSLPEGFISVPLNSLTYFYYLGTFYLRDATTGNYAIIAAPIGAVVPYIPTEYQKVTINGTQYYQYAGIYYRPTSVNGQLLYEVVKV